MMKEILVPVLGHGYITEREAAAITPQRRFPLAVLEQFPSLKTLTLPDARPGEEYAIQVVPKALAYSIAMGTLPLPSTEAVCGSLWPVVATNALTAVQGGGYVAIVAHRPLSAPYTSREHIRSMVDLDTGDEIFVMDARLTEVARGSGIYVRAAMVAFDGDKVWAIQPDDLEEWVLPGGHIDPGEHPVDAAVREMHEETGVRVIPTRFLGVLKTDHSHTQVFLGIVVGVGRPTTPDEISRTRPVEISQLISTDRDWLYPRLEKIKSYLSEAAWDPAKHPRGPKGQWATVAGGEFPQVYFNTKGVITHGPKELVGKRESDLRYPLLTRGKRAKTPQSARNGRYVDGAYGGHSRTSAGNLGEMIVMGALSKHFGQPVTHYSAGKFKAFPIDFRADGRAVEVKLLSIDGSRAEIRMKNESIDRKLEIARLFKLKPVMVGVLIDYKAGTATLFKRDGIKRFPFTAMKRIGTYNVKQSVAKAPQTKPGHEPLFRLLSTMSHPSPLLRQWQKSAQTFARQYQKQKVAVKTSESVSRRVVQAYSVMEGVNSATAVSYGEEG